MTYEIGNAGGSDAAANYDVNLVLSPDPVIGNSDEYYLFFETIPNPLRAGYILYRNNSNPASFNLFVSQRGTVVADGAYYMAVWVDDTNRVVEADESDNASLSANRIPIGQAALAATQQFGAIHLKGKQQTASLPDGKGNHTYNGKELPSGRVLAMQKVKITTTPDGNRKMEALSPPISKSSNAPVLSKTIHSGNQVIFPVTEAKPMSAPSQATDDR